MEWVRVILRRTDFQFELLELQEDVLRGASLVLLSNNICGKSLPGTSDVCTTVGKNSDDLRIGKLRERYGRKWTTDLHLWIAIEDCAHG